MNKIPYKFLTAVGVFIIMVVGVTLASKFESFDLSAITTGLLLADSLVLLIILGILLKIRDDIQSKNKKTKSL